MAAQSSGFPLDLESEAHQAVLSQNAGSRRHLWFSQGMGLVGLMLIGVCSMGGFEFHAADAHSASLSGSERRSEHDAAVAGFHPVMDTHGVRTRGLHMTSGKVLGDGEATRDLDQPIYIDPQGKLPAIDKPIPLAEYLAKRTAALGTPVAVPKSSGGGSHSMQHDLGFAPLFFSPPKAQARSSRMVMSETFAGYRAKRAGGATAPAHVPTEGKGFGGGEATRDPIPTHVDPNDPKSREQAIHPAETFADYMSKRRGGYYGPMRSGGVSAPTPVQAGGNSLGKGDVAEAPLTFGGYMAKRSSAAQAPAPVPNDSGVPRWTPPSSSTENAHTPVPADTAAAAPNFADYMAKRSGGGGGGGAGASLSKRDSTENAHTPAPADTAAAAPNFADYMAKRSGGGGAGDSLSKSAVTTAPVNFDQYMSQRGGGARIPRAVPAEGAAFKAFMGSKEGSPLGEDDALMASSFAAGKTFAEYVASRGAMRGAKVPSVNELYAPAKAREGPAPQWTPDAAARSQGEPSLPVPAARANSYADYMAKRKAGGPSR